MGATRARSRVARRGVRIALCAAALAASCSDNVGGWFGEHYNGPYDDPTATLTVTSPNGGEAWTVGTAAAVTWTTTGLVGDVTIEFSPDDGASWTTLVASTANDGSQTVTVPDTPSAQCRVRVSETDGSPSDTSNATLTVYIAPPTITAHPAGQMVTEGQTATFSVTASGSGTITYQWKKDGANVTGGTGGTTASYTTPATVLADSGAQFTCVVTNERGSVESNPATLTVNPATYKIVVLTTGAVISSDSIADLLTNDAYKTTKLVLKYISAGSFRMGGDWPDELPVHTVNITQPFYMGVFEVTQRQWYEVEATWPSYHTTTPDKRPVEQVSWNDINDSGGFMDSLSSLASMSFRLPTEAEWEYCCRAGTSTWFSYGNTVDAAWMWYWSNSSGETHEVATTPSKPNPWGLYDMHGNVYEWCEDWYDYWYYLVSPADDPPGPASGSYRVLRGGSWNESGGYCCSASRCSWHEPWSREDSIGFRVVAAVAGP